jgi:hypothetical protein
MALHETDLNRNRHILNSFNHAADLGLSDAIIAGGGITTYPLLQAAIVALTPHETQTNMLRQINKNIDVGIAIGLLAGDPPASLALLELVCTTADPSLSATERRTFAFQG